MNKYGLPENQLEEIRARDTKCIYCHKTMNQPSSGGFRGDWATIEHLNHLPPWNNPDTVAICCGSCNSSRGIMPICKWFEIPYCINKDINIETVANPVRDYINKYEKNVSKRILRQ